LDWNVLFLQGTDSATRQLAIQIIEDSITQYINHYNQNHTTNFQVVQQFVFCPCDTLLYNISAVPLGGTGQGSNPPPPSGGIKPGGSGDGTAYVSNNESFTMDTLISSLDTATKLLFHLNSFTANTSQLTLAIMDSGLDTAYFDHSLLPLIWIPQQSRVINNFLWYRNNKPLYYAFDDDTLKHGTAVTALSLQAVQGTGTGATVQPRLMVLKVLDNRRIGSTFSVSCALSYAAQQHATLINASLGYYSTGAVDSILRYYVDTCAKAGVGIPVVAAAGNLPGAHNPALLCTPAPSTNALGPKRLFFPACFTRDLPNVISVTGLVDRWDACEYQNYSNSLVSVGVYNHVSPQASCCQYNLAFLSMGYEGTSFAAPVVSGKMMGVLIGAPSTVPGNALRPILGPTASSNATLRPWVTINGQYIDY
jgi:hypothetical protein